jgi:hypothetical protein
VTVSSDQIQKAKAEGLENVESAARVADETGNKFYHLCALLEKESGGRNVYGHDVGGALSGFPEPVNEYNYAVFRWLVFTKAQPSNGIGPMQLTFKGFFADMERQGLRPWNPYENIYYGAKLWLGYYRVQRAAGFSRDDSIRRAGKQYNGSATYGDRLLVIMDKWIDIVGNSDYA